jgi:hypothetical protein
MITTDMQVYYHFIKPNEGLKGKTPSETCGIVINGEKQVDDADTECRYFSKMISNLFFIYRTVPN